MFLSCFILWLYLQYRGGRTYQRGFSDKLPAGINQFVSGDTHFQSVRDANRGRGRIDHQNQSQFTSRFEYRPPQSKANANANANVPPLRNYPNQAFRPPAFYNNQQQFGPQFQSPQQQQQFQQNQHPRNPQQQHFQQNQQTRNQKLLNYRNWEFAKKRPSPNCGIYCLFLYGLFCFWYCSLLIEFNFNVFWFTELNLYFTQFSKYVVS